MPRRGEDDSDDDAPKPFNAYLVLGLVVVVVVVGAFMNRDAITALATDILFPNHQPQMPIAIEVASEPFVAEPGCAAWCGRACWLVASGSAEGTFISAHGAIGTLGCDSMCWSVSDALGRCCRNADCAKGSLCHNGVCSVNE